MGGSTTKQRRFKLPKADTPILIVTILLVAFGLLMMYSASFAYAYYNNGGDSYFYIRDQLKYALMGFGAMAVASVVNYRIYHKFAMLLYLVTLAMLVITLFMPSRNGAHRWIFIGSFQFQPSEIAKFAIILLFSHFISVGYSKMKGFVYGFLQFGLYLGVYAVIMLKQPHTSGTILIGLIGLTLMLVGGVRIRYLAPTAALAGVGLFAFLKLSNRMGYALNRIVLWLHPFSDPYGDTFQTDQALIAVGSGGLLGRGIGNSMQKYLYVPEPQNDFIFAIICEELGFVGAVAVILGFALFVWFGIRIALAATDKFGALLATGITAHIGLQAILNIAVVTNTIPNTGISLPFFSYGGTALIITLAEVGVLLSISRYGKGGKD